MVSCSISEIFIHFNFNLAIGLLIHSIEMNFIHMDNISTPRLIIQQFIRRANLLPFTSPQMVD